MVKRREYGDGSIYQRASDGRWVATIEVGESPTGKRRRVTVSAKTRAEVVRKLRDKKLAIEQGGLPTQSARTTVKQWAAAWLEIKERQLSPRGYNAAASSVRRWIVPTIGHRRLDVLTPADLRAVADAQRQAGRKEATAAATHRTLLNMLRSAIVEGHQVPQRVLLVPAPRTAKSDRMDLSVEHSVACLRAAAELPHGTRWALALLYGVRQGEALGLTWDHVDFERDEIRIEWQLDNLPYRIPRDRSSGFRVPDGYEARHLVDAWHLVRPKSKKGFRTLPMFGGFRRAMEAWRDAAPANPWGLVWPTTTGRPVNDKTDLREWHALQAQAGVAHPAGRPYHVHECRNVTATQLGETGADPVVIQSLLGHATAAQSGDYRRIHRQPKKDALAKVAELLPYEPAGQQPGE